MPDMSDEQWAEVDRLAAEDAAKESLRGLNRTDPSVWNRIKDDPAVQREIAEFEAFLMRQGGCFLMVSMPNLPPRDRWDKEAEDVIREAFDDTNRREWINVSATAIATAALSALHDAGFRLMGHRKSAGGDDDASK